MTIHADTGTQGVAVVLPAYREAATLAYADAFRAIMLAFVIATLLVPLLRKVVPAAAPRPVSH